MLKSVFTFLVCFLFILSLNSRDVEAEEYRFEHYSCIFSYIFPGAPAVRPLWRDEIGGGHEKFLKKFPLSVEKHVQGVKAEYKKENLATGNKVYIQTYCLEFQMDEEQNALKSQDMLNILRESISGLDDDETKSVLSQEEIEFTEQKNGIRWISIHGSAQSILEDKLETMRHYRDVFVYDNKALIVMISTTESDDKNDENDGIVQTLLRSLILAE